MIDSLYVATESNDIIYQRHFIPCTHSPEDVSRCIASESHLCITETYVIVRIARHGVNFVVVVSKDLNFIALEDFLSNLSDCLSGYFHLESTSQTIKDNLPIVVTILDEMIHHGSPAFSDLSCVELLVPPSGTVDSAAKILNKLIGNDDVDIPGEGMGVGSGLGIGTGITGAGSKLWWRKLVGEQANESIIVDAKEYLSCIVRKDDDVVASYYTGCINIKSRLNGTATCSIAFQNSDILHNPKTNDASSMVSFHPCVNRDKWKDENVLLFTPPHGHFTILRYTTGVPCSRPPFSMSTNVTIPNPNTLDIDVVCSPHAGFCLPYCQSSTRLVLDVVRFDIPCPRGTTELLTNECSMGYVTFGGDCVSWCGTKWILDPSKKFSMKCSVRVSSDRKLCHSDKMNLIKLEFVLRDVCLSGLSVEAIDVLHTTNSISKSVRKSTYNGCIEYRIS